MSITLNVTLKLRSDAIFGSGYSIPGGEDIAVCRDSLGFPYLKGTTLKGLLRESLENVLDWTGAPASTADLLLGREDWQGAAGERRVHFTALTLSDPPADPEECFDSRRFTALENGVVREGSLREAACICSGLCFKGQMFCAEQDAALLQQALKGIKWVGTLRSRGFGRVSCTAHKAAAVDAGRSLAPAACLHLRLRTMTPLLITNLSRSSNNGYQTREFIPGAALRGLVMGQIAASRPQWFAENKRQLLTGVRFLDALPAPAGRAALPSIKGFYEDKGESDFCTVVINGDFPAGYKRARTGSFCSIENETLHFWNADTDGVTRIQRGKNGEQTRPFSTRYLEAGQSFDGFILLDDPALAPEIARALPGTVWLGADRYEGFGQCSVDVLEAADCPAQQTAYGYDKDHLPGEVLYLLALSPFTMLDAYGDPCGLDEAALAESLGVEKIEIEHCSTSMSEYGAYNQQWQCHAPALRMYDRGSIFKLKCSSAPALDALQQVQRTGLGVRRCEGFGQVLFLRKELFEGIRGKQRLEPERPCIAPAVAQARRSRCLWLMRESKALRSIMREDGLSPSELGKVQALCEKALRDDRGMAELDEFFRKNLEDRGPRHAGRFKRLREKIDAIRNRPVGELIGAPCKDSQQERLRLLIELIDHS